MTGQAYPALSTLLSPDKIAGDFGVFEGAADQLLGKLRYTNLIVESSPDNDSRYYSLTLVTEELAVDMFGSGLKLVLFPATTAPPPPPPPPPPPASPSPPAVSEIPVSFGYRWPILRHVAAFKTLSFAHSAKAFLDLALEIIDVTPEEFVAGIVNCFIDDPAPYQALAGALQSWDQGNGTTPLSGLDLTTIPVGYTAEQYVAMQADALGVDIYRAAFESFVDDANLDDAIGNVVRLFQTWVEGVTKSDLERLLLPQFALELTAVKLAIEAPRSVLIPLKPDGSEEPTANWRLLFTAGGMRYDSETGFDIAIDEGLTIDFPKAMIPKIGVTLDFEGIKLDLSRTKNIAEADADGRPPDFVGVYIDKAEIGLPQKWFAKHQPAGGAQVTLGIVGRKVLIGSGGLTGLIGLEVLTTGAPPNPNDPGPPPELQFVLGKAAAGGGDRKGYIVGFSAFDMKFRQNRLLESRIKGSLTLPGFDPADPQGNRIDIALFLADDGDFEVTASVAGGRKLNVPNVFSFNLFSASVGKDDHGVYVRCSGDLSFEDNNLLKTLIKQPIHLEELMVHSDGSVSLKGGKVALPKAAVIAVGPAKISITAVHFGALEQEHKGVMRKYRYIGFDGAVSVNPGAVGGHGDGICFCYSVDGLAFHSFIRIDGIGIKMMIPGSATPESAMLLLEGYLSLKEPEYAGTLKFGLPKLKIFGGASMRYNTRVPAWIVRVDLELPKALPLGSTGLGVYSFSGLFGLRFMAGKAAISPPLAADASWGDYYRGPPARGISLQKFLPPDKTAGSRNPFSVGVGVGLCTASDNGKVFSAQLFLLVSLPNLIMLEGAGDVLAEKRVSITDDPPYYAYIALSPGESIELGVGVNYLIPKDTGKVLNLTAVLEAAFFFRNASAWYVNFGTKNKPAHADILGLFNGYAYLMLSASGIETGAGVSFDFHKGYGPIAIDAHAYLDFWAYIAFERFQAGGGIAMGGYLDIKCCGFGFNISLAAGLAVEAPKPFHVAGSVEVCVSIKILKKKITKCCELSFRWDGSDSADASPVPVFTAAGPPAASAVHMVSGSTYEVLFSTSPDPPPDQPGLPGMPSVPSLPPIPIDCFIDVKFTKPVDPSAVSEIGGHTGPAVGATEKMPPRYGSDIVDHSYALEKVRLEVRENGNWVDYHPYAALAPEGVLDAAAAAQLATMPLGVWQKQEQGYSQIRFLALTPFSWMGPMVGHRPEELGVTPQSTYCVGRRRERRCVTWTEPKAYLAGLDYLRDGILYRVDGDRMGATAFVAPRLQPVSLAIGPAGQASFQFLEPVAECSIDLVTTAPWVKLHWQRRKPMVVDGVPVGPLHGPPEFEDAGPPTHVQRAALTGPVFYHRPDAPIDRVLIETPVPDLARIAELEEALAQAEESWMFLPVQRDAIARQVAELRAALKAEHDRTCVAGGAGGPSAEALAQLAALYEELKEVLQLLQEPRQLLEERFDRFCAGLAALPPGGPREPGRGNGVAGTMVSAMGAIIPGLGGPREKPGPPRMSAEECCALTRAIEEAETRLSEIVAAIDALGHQGAGDGGAWPCGTFVREICRLSQKDYAYNQSLPGIAAIAADYSRMRAAVEGTIAPVWRPGESYRIRLTVSDKVNAADPSESDYYVHFRTDGPIGHFPPPPTQPDDPPPPPQPTDDERQEIPERSLRFYVDMERSTPDPSGKLLYAKPTYTRNVKIRLFFDKPHALHFFADWPGNGRKYALELAVKDPAEASPGAANPLLPHETVIIDAPHLGAQSWEEDPAPKTSLEFRTLAAFRDPANPPDAEGNSLVCLSDGGEPITSLAKHLLVEIPELDPDKLYTAVVLNRRTDLAETAEVLSYGFKTSLFPDFPTHIGSHRLEGEDGAARLAVFDIEHVLPGSEAQTVAAALALVAGGPVADGAAWPDPFDGLVYGLLDLPPLPRAATVEFNFVTAMPGGMTFGLLIRSPEPFYDPRLPAATLATTIALLENGAIRPAHVLLSRDCSQAFVMAASGAFPTQNVAIRFASLDWEGKIASPASVDSDAFSKGAP